MAYPKIVALATANPKTQFSQEELLALSPYTDGRRRGFFLNSGIERRYLYLDKASFRAHRTLRAGALLIGDAPGFYDPFTGEGVRRGLRSAELAAREIAAALADPGLSTSCLYRFDRQQRMAFAQNERLGAVLQAIIRRSAAANSLARLLRRHQPLADLLLGVIGDLLPPRTLLAVNTLRQLLL